MAGAESRKVGVKLSVRSILLTVFKAFNLDLVESIGDFQEE